MEPRANICTQSKESKDMRIVGRVSTQWAIDLEAKGRVFWPIVSAQKKLETKQGSGNDLRRRAFRYLCVTETGPGLALLHWQGV